MTPLLQPAAEALTTLAEEEGGHGHGHDSLNAYGIGIGAFVALLVLLWIVTRLNRDR
ncbi:hypothetical protein [Streptomyces sp. RFCAC02]|uniref:hypothetical protein n=1 Tax=Streptomyces sp. RFCAC02 TaxID=2499143 RepID=UPI00143E04E2|nr:hypothetical protein [Streptomyces sp. RFCAC02]